MAPRLHHTESLYGVSFRLELPIWYKIQPEVDAGAMVTVTENSIRIKKIPI